MSDRYQDAAPDAPATLIHTVHHRGRIYRKGMTAAQVGPDAPDIGGHNWSTGRAPAKPASNSEDGQPGGQPLGAPPSPPLTGLIGGPDAGFVRGDPGAPSPDPGDGGGAKKTGGRGRAGSGS